MVNNDKYDAGYFPLLSLKDILVKLDIVVEDLGLSENLLKRTFFDCYTDKKISKNEIKISGVFQGVYYYEITIDLNKKDLIDIFVVEDRKIITHYDKDGIAPDILRRMGNMRF